MEGGGREEHSRDDDDRVVADTQRGGASGRGLDRDAFLRCVPDDNGHPYRIPSLHHLRFRLRWRYGEAGDLFVTGGKRR